MAYIRSGTGGGTKIINAIPDFVLYSTGTTSPITINDVSEDDSILCWTNQQGASTSLSVTGGTKIGGTNWFVLVRPTASTVILQTSGTYPYARYVHLKHKPYNNVKLISYSSGSAASFSNQPAGCAFYTTGNMTAMSNSYIIGSFNGCIGLTKEDTTINSLTISGSYPNIGVFYNE